MNPYRDAFYRRQAEWHRYDGAESVRTRHDRRARYYDWYTRDWLPEDREAEILDVGCGSGQFLHFLAGKGYTRAQGLDLDADQVAIARSLGLKAEAATVADFLDRSDASYDLVAMLDIIEHFTLEELFPLMETITARLKPGGRLIASVPNAESPTGPACYFADITHEMAYTPTNLGEMLFCHGLDVEAIRDPWPAPIDLPRSLYRGAVGITRKLAGLKYRSIGLEPPRVWSNVFWVVARRAA